MTSDKARKREVRARMAATGEPYTEAARKVARQAPVDLTDIPPATVPAPVAVMMTRHVDAAALHLGAWRQLACDHKVPGVSRYGDRDGKPLDTAHAQIVARIHDLLRWSERTAVASGAIPALPNGIGGDTPEQKQARETLYPSRHLWCASGPGRSLPQPGEDPGAGQAGHRVTHCLPGRVPETRLTARGDGAHVQPARHVVPGTPAAPIWEAEERLNAYAGDWMDRAGDTPADLAAALDGLAELATTFAGAVAGVLAEIDRRHDDRTLTGVFGLKEATAAVKDAASTLRAAMYQARASIDGAAAALPAPKGVRVSDTLARRLKGRTLAQIRHDLGMETWTDRQRGKIGPTDTRRLDALRRIVQWMHAAGVDHYDPDAHAADDPARAEG